MTSEEFKALVSLQDACVKVRFIDGQTIVARLLSVTIDFDGSQHFVYERSGKDAVAGSVALYAPGEEVVSCVAFEEGCDIDPHLY